MHVHSLAALEHGLRLPLVLGNGGQTQQQNSEQISAPIGDSAPSEVSAYLPYEALVEHANENGQVKIVFVMYRRLAGLLKPRHLSPSYENNNLQNLQQNPQQPGSQTERFMSSETDNFIHPHHARQVGNGHRLGSAFQAGSFPSSAAVTIVNSDVVGLIIASDQHRSSYDRLSTPLSAPLELTLRHLTVDNVTNGRCAFWDIKRGDWSTSGCSTVSSNRSHTVCRCDHLTNFAVLMDIAHIPVRFLLIFTFLTILLTFFLI